jgi:hypothetical protein
MRKGRRRFGFMHRFSHFCFFASLLASRSKTFLHSIPLVGISFGFAVVYFVWLGHTKLNYRTRKRMAIALSLVIALSSAAAFSVGCWYMKEVWQGNDLYSGEYATATFFVWLALCLSAHGVYYRLTLRKLAEAKALRAGGTTTTTTTTNPTHEHDTVVGDALESASSMRREEVVESSMKGEWRYNSQVFQPPKSNNCVALPAMMNIGRKPQQQRQKQEHEQQFDDSKNDQDNDPQKTNNTKISNNVDDDEIIVPGIDLDGIAEEKEVDHCASNRQTPNIIPPTATNKRVRMNTGETVTTNDTIDSIECCAKMDHSSLAARSDDIETQDERHPSSIDEPALTDHIIDDLINNEGDNIFSVGSIEEREIPTLWVMMKDNSCCRRRRHYQAPRQKGWSLLVMILKWTLWTLACSLHLSFVIVNIGASYQQNKVRGALIGTYEKLYPGNYTTGAMCAWDEASPDADIRTFHSFQDVMDVEYTVIHCGDCGYCSNWNDLNLQWTTRDYLAKKAKDW